MKSRLRAATSVLLASCAFAPALAACGEEAPPGAGPAKRIITLSPDLAELVWTAGAGPTLVGTIEHSDYPPEAREIPRVGDAYGLDFERIGALHPDLILAWDGGTPERWIQPPPRASAPRMATTHVIQRGPSPCSDAWKCSRTYGDGSPPKTRKIIRNV